MSLRVRRQHPCWPARRSLAALALWALFGCAGRPTEPDPVPLSFAEASAAPEPADYRALAERVKRFYVGIVVRDPTAAGRGAREATRRTAINDGSATIVDADGHAVTAAHVAVRAGLAAEVSTLDGRTLDAKVLHVDPARELALLKIEGVTGLTPPSFAAGDSVADGEPVLAIGTPNRRLGTVAHGVVLRHRWPSRLSYGPYGYDDALKLALTVEPGYSGGPVFNGRGELVGVLASFVLGDTSRTPYVPTGLAYAVPTRAVLAYLAEVLGGGAGSPPAVAGAASSPRALSPGAASTSVRPLKNN